jgi:hypothetical protein
MSVLKLVKDHSIEPNVSESIQTYSDSYTERKAKLYKVKMQSNLGIKHINSKILHIQVHRHGTEPHGYFPRDIGLHKGQNELIILPNILPP